MKRRFTAISGVSNINVTLRSLSLGSRDSVTGWRKPSFSETTIEMIVIPKAANSLHLVPGLYAQLDAVGRTRATTPEIGDEIKTAAGVYYEIKTLTRVPVGDLEWFRDYDLTELSLHE